MSYARLMVRVKQRDLDSACPLQSRSCPIAYALRRETGNLWVVSKGWAVRAEGQRFTTAAPLPMRARLFVRNYDAGNRLARPFIFFLKVPQRTLTNAARYKAHVEAERGRLQRDLRKAVAEERPAIEASIEVEMKAQPWRAWSDRERIIFNRVEARVQERFAKRLHDVARLAEGWRR